MTDRLAIIHSFQIVFVWDFISNTYTIWNINQSQELNDLVGSFSILQSHLQNVTWPRLSTQLFLSHNSLVMVNDHGVLSWEIPAQLDFQVPPSRSVDWSYDSAAKPNPTHRVTYEGENLYKPLAWTFSHWYSSLDLPTLFDVEEHPVQSEFGYDSADATSSGTNLTRVSRYRLHITPTATTQTELDSAGLESTSTQAYLQRLETIPLPLTPESYHFLHRISGDILLSFYNDCKPGYHFGIIFSPFTASPYFPQLQTKRMDERSGMVGLREGDDFGIVGMKLDREGAESHSLTFCSASGRVACSVVNSPDPGSHSIKVFDFSGILVR